ncbi:hypothetical protein [Fimbriiglobus ruber]|uniref:Uncharacterized protein n=1 Tax=Fimbriiglobus ruber TaxID=1908690 RepID=A0A225DDZ6_9BACT|nr:hypothetical protein [Fimbriiglobus ruber]OWK35566.1 hypothetical protein FRUB_08129 [Fimbriiglobus ruber]
MKVGDFQKYLRALAEVIATKAPAKELTDAADSLAPFAAHTMQQFATFLKLAESKYRETGQLPDGKTPPAPKPKKELASKAPAPTLGELVSTVAALKVRLKTDHSLTKEGVAAELNRFEKLSKNDLLAAVKQLGMQSTPKTKVDALAKIVNYTLAVQAGVERADA